jgi:SAM-dependent methyltransferase
LNRKLSLLQRPRAVARAQDIMEARFPEGSFDVVYAKSVLHHFSDTAAIARELFRLLRPGGVIVSDDPLQTEPINRLARLVYRPFQSDRSWEWPFTRRSLGLIRRYFDVVDIQGTRGFTKIALPLCLFPVDGRASGIGRWAWRMDKRFARSLPMVLLFCWNVTMLLRKRSC